MKDLVFITANCPTKEQEEALEKCVNSVFNSGFHVALISHTHVPIHIQKKCNFYLYDYLNDISHDHELMGPLTYWIGDGNLIDSAFFNKGFYGFAIYRMFCMASQIAINFGYQNIHHIEYDCEIIDSSILEEHSELLNEYDSIIYTNTGDSNGFLFGNFKSFKVNKLPKLFSNFDKEEMTKQIKGMNKKYLENFTKKIFIESGKILFRNESYLEKSLKRGRNFYGRNIHHTFFYNKKDNTLNVFYRSFKNETENVLVVVNNNKIISIKAEPKHWYIQSLGDFDNIKTVRIDNSEKILNQVTFDDSLREIYKLNSFIREENN